MCDYSMHAVKNRKAVVGDKVKTSDFKRTSSPGLESLSEPGMAICLIPGTGVEFDEPVQHRDVNMNMSLNAQPFKIGRYVRKTGDAAEFKDAFQFPDGTMVLMAYLVTNQTGTVTYVPEEIIKQTEQPAKKPVARSRLRTLRDLVRQA
jgi:hypothetical protein